MTKAVEQIKKILPTLSDDEIFEVQRLLTEKGSDPHSALEWAAIEEVLHDRSQEPMDGFQASDENAWKTLYADADRIIRNRATND